MGFENVYALKNGTMGWQLAGLQVEEGSDRLEMPDLAPPLGALAKIGLIEAGQRNHRRDRQRQDHK